MPTLDPQIVNLAKAIRQVESNGNFAAQGKSGEYGAYQFMPATWTHLAATYLGDPKADITNPANQNQVVYKQLLDWKNQGYNVGQIASMWNAGPGRANAYIDGNKGVNSSGASYDTANYAAKVATAYHMYQTPGFTPEPQQQPSQPSSFIGDLTSDFAKRNAAVQSVRSDVNAGKQSSASGLLQSMGQAAGMIGDTVLDAGKAVDRTLTGGAITNAVSKGLTAEAPYVNAAKTFAQNHPIISNVLGTAASAIGLPNLNTAATAGALKDKLAQDHPEANANIDALLNIASVLPVGEGAAAIAGDAKGVVGSATTNATASMADHAVSTVADNYRNLFQSTKSLKNTFDFVTSKGSDPAQILTERKILPDIKDGHADFTTPINTLEQEVAQKSRTLDEAISKYPNTVPAEQLKAQVKADIAKNPEFRAQGRVPEMQKKAEAIVDGYAQQEGKDRFTLSDIQSFKKGQYSLSSRYRKAADFGSADDHSAVASAFRQAVEDNAKDVAVKDLNKQVGGLEDTLTMLEKANGATVRGGRLGTYVGEAIGSMVGTQAHNMPIVGPILGALGGRYIASQLQKSAIAGPITRALMKLSTVAPDNKVVQNTLDFIQKVNSGEKVLPDDSTLEFLSQLSTRLDIPLLPAPVQEHFRSIINSGKTINLPASTQSSLDTMERANPAIKQPQ